MTGSVGAASARLAYQPQRAIAFAPNLVTQIGERTLTQRSRDGCYHPLLNHPRNPLFV